MNDLSSLDESASPLPDDLARLTTAISTLPSELRQTLEPLLGNVTDGIRRRRRILTLVQDAIGQLRLDMKYLMFDLEATRRERDTYRQRLDTYEK